MPLGIKIEETDISVGVGVPKVLAIREARDKAVLEVQILL